MGPGRYEGPVLTGAGPLPALSTAKATQSDSNHGEESRRSGRRILLLLERREELRIVS
jgi:hypothetical protein